MLHAALLRQHRHLVLMSFRRTGPCVLLLLHQGLLEVPLLGCCSLCGSIDAFCELGGLQRLADDRCAAGALGCSLLSALCAQRSQRVSSNTLLESFGLGPLHCRTASRGFQASQQASKQAWIDLQ